MVKRRPLSFDSNQLTKDLKESTGKGVDALFSPVPETPKTEFARVKKTKSPTPKTESKKTKLAVTQKRTKQYDNIASKQVSNIAILQLDDVDIGHLREAAYKAQTYRFAEREVEWIKDTAHSLSKEIRRGKVAQVDILRVAIKLFENALATGKEDLIKIFERMK